MDERLNVAILEKHQLTIDGYCYRLGMIPEINIIGSFLFAEDLANEFEDLPIDLLITGIDVSLSRENRNPFPILYFLNQFVHKKPALKTLVVSYINQLGIIDSLLELGVSGIVSKEDQKSAEKLGNIIEVIANGGVFFSEGIHQDLIAGQHKSILTKRQMEALSLCAAYPDEDTSYLSKKLDISSSTFRNLLSMTYLRLGVRTRSSAIAKARQLGLIPTDSISEDFFNNEGTKTDHSYSDPE
jgi:DNA-binding NarL/FixJ family response regulator